MENHTKNNNCLGGCASFKRGHVHCAVLLVLGPALAMQASAQAYANANADGSKTDDLNAAAATWAKSTEFKAQWGLGAMNSQFAYAAGFTGKAISIGVLDSGYYAQHPELPASRFFPVTSSGISGVLNAKNNDHGTLVSGSIGAARDGKGMHGVAFDATVYEANTNATDGFLFGTSDPKFPTSDARYFFAAYDALAAKGVRVISNSWGSQPKAGLTAESYSTLANVVDAYGKHEQVRKNNNGQGTWLDAAVKVSRNGVVNNFSAGNTGYDHASLRGAYAYFHPELEGSWMTTTGYAQSKGQAYNKCGIAKYWCVAAPTGTPSTTYSGDPKDPASLKASASDNFNGTSAAAPHASAALALIMERYPFMTNAQALTVLFTTSRNMEVDTSRPIVSDRMLGTNVTPLKPGSSNVPNRIVGWGLVDLQKAMNGPAQFLGRFDYNLPGGKKDVWSNDISQEAIAQRKVEEQAEVATWQSRKATVPGGFSSDRLATHVDGLRDDAVPLLRELAASIATGDFAADYQALQGNAIAASVFSRLLAGTTYGQYLESHAANPEYIWVAESISDQLITALDESSFSISDSEAAAVKGQLQFAHSTEVDRAAFLTKKLTDPGAYEASLTKSGGGTLTLTGRNSYSGGTQLQGGTLGVGASTALGTGTLAMSDGTTLQAAADGLKLANAVTLSGIGNIDTQAFGLQLSGNITDGSTPGGLAKLGSGALTLSGANTYSGPTGVIAGTLRAGSSAGFSPRSAFFVGTGAQLDLGGFNQAIGSLLGSGNISLGAATLTTGADNSSTTFSGQIDGSGGLAKTGNGAFTLASASTYSGGTSLKAGQLNVGHSNALGTGMLSMDDGTTLGFATDGLNVANNVALTGTRDPVFDTGAFTATLSGVIGGTGFLTKNGSGVLVTTGANTYSGATMVAAGTLQAGAVNTFSAASAMTVSTGATLDLAGYSQRIAAMNLAGTVVVAGAIPGGGAGSAGGTTLTVTGPWVGSGGLLTLGTVSAGPSDRVLLSGSNAVASGTTTVQIGHIVGLGAATPGNGMEVIGTADGASIQGNAFVLAGERLDVGAFAYRLNNLGSGGYLSSSTPSGQPSYRGEVPLFAALPAQLRQANLTMLGNMHQRMGDDDVKAAGTPAAVGATGGQRRAWGRVISTQPEIRQSGDASPQSRGNLDGFQAGTDLLGMSNWRAGLYVGQLDGTRRVSGLALGAQNLNVGSTDLRNQYLGAYGTYTGDGGFHADAVLQAGRHRYDAISQWTVSGSAGSGKGRSLLASVEVGQSFALGGAGNWKVEPQFQLTHQRLSLDDVAIAGSTLVRQHADSAWQARLGLRVRGEVGMGVGGARLQPYGRVNLYRASGGNDVASFIAPGGRAAVSSSAGGTSGELAVGATLALTPSFGLYGELGKLWSAGGATRVKTSAQGSVGVRVLW